MIRRFKLNNYLKGEINQRCRSCNYTWERISKTVPVIVFDDADPNNKFLLEIMLHQRNGDPYKRTWASREIKGTDPSVMKAFLKQHDPHFATDLYLSSLSLEELTSYYQECIKALEPGYNDDRDWRLEHVRANNI